MIDHNEVFKRVLRKRKIPQETVVRDLNDNVSNKVEYNVLTEHSYFRTVEKKSCRWPDTKNASNNFTEILLTNSAGYSENCHSLPDYLKGYISSSNEEDDDDEDDDDNEVKSLSLLLKIEFENDLKSKKLKNRNASKKKLPLNTSFKKLYPNTVIRKIKNHDLSNKQPEIEPDKSHNRLSSSQDSESSITEVRECTNDVENPEKTVQIMSICSIDTTIPENQNINEFQSMPLSDSSNNCTLEKSNAENIFTGDDVLLSNDLLNKKDSIEDSNKDSQNDMLNLPLVCTNNVTESSKPSEEHLEPYERPIVKNSSLLPENISPPFEWYHIIYLAMKNSTNEYVTCQEIHNFSRRWFPFYCKKSWTGIIDTTLNHYKDTFFINYSISISFDNVWTVKKESIHSLELKLMSVVEQFENAIKSSMKNPDQLSLLLKGYGVINLGYNKK